MDGIASSFRCAAFLAMTGLRVVGMSLVKVGVMKNALKEHDFYSHG